VRGETVIPAAENLHNSGLMRRSIQALLDHLVGTAKQRRRHHDAKRLCRRGINKQLNLGGSLNGGQNALSGKRNVHRQDRAIGFCGRTLD
jgi:hypothetical protein